MNDFTFFAWMHCLLRVIDIIGACLYAVDAVCMALTAASAQWWKDTPRKNTVDTAVALIQVTSLYGELFKRVDVASDAAGGE